MNVPKVCLHVCYVMAGGAFAGGAGGQVPGARPDGGGGGRGAGCHASSPAALRAGLLSSKLHWANPC